MNDIAARYEFRIFAPHIGAAEMLLRALAPCRSIAESREVYLLDCSHNDELNVKIRHGVLERKRLLRRHRGLEQWQPDGQWEFPLSVGDLRTLWGNRTLEPDHARSPGTLVLDELLQMATGPAPQLQRVNVFKRRFRFETEHCSAEHDHLLVNGAALESLALESAEPEAVLELQSALRLEGLENQSYPLMMCRLLGQSMMPDEKTYGH
jgi:hypothetical protein